MSHSCIYSARHAPPASDERYARQMPWARPSPPSCQEENERKRCRPRRTGGKGREGCALLSHSFWWVLPALTVRRVCGDSSHLPTSSLSFSKNTHTHLHSLPPADSGCSLFSCRFSPAAQLCVVVFCGLVSPRHTCVLECGACTHVHVHSFVRVCAAPFFPPPKHIYIYILLCVL